MTQDSDWVSPFSSYRWLIDSLVPLQNELSACVNWRYPAFSYSFLGVALHLTHGRFCRVFAVGNSRVELRSLARPKRRRSPQTTFARVAVQRDTVSIARGVGRVRLHLLPSCGRVDQCFSILLTAHRSSPQVVPGRMDSDLMVSIASS